MQNEDDFIEVGLHCAKICSVIERGSRGKTVANLTSSFVEAIEELARSVMIINLALYFI
jgi:hypothetical protein